MAIDLLGLLDGNVRVLADQPAGGQPRVFGVVTAVVTDVDDSERLGRVRVRFSFGGRTESAWARVASPWAGANRGAYFVPEVDDEVVVAFGHGNLGHPYVLGFLWSQPSPPPETSPKTGRSVIRSARGHTIEIDDNKGTVELRTSGGCHTVLNDSKKTIELGIGETKLTIDGTTVSVKAAQISLEATGTLNLKGQLVKINS
jgi:phage baseplate assembly protein V